MLGSVFKISAFSLFMLLLTAGCSTNKTTTAKIYKNKSPQQIVDLRAVSAQGIQQKIGTVTLQDSAEGLSITSRLTDLPSGFHGFHIHEYGSCEPAEKNGEMHAA